MNPTIERVPHPSFLSTAQPAEDPIVDGAKYEGVAQVTRRTWRSLFEVIGWPLVVGVVLVLTLVVVFLVHDLVDGNLASVVSGQVALWRHVEFRSAVIVALLTGTLVAHSYEEAATWLYFERPQPRFPDTDSEEFQHQEETVDPIRLRRAGLVGALVITAIVPALYTEPARFLRLETYALPSVLFDLAMGAALGWIAARMLYSSIVQDRTFANP